jgi:hypothetical protein
MAKDYSWMEKTKPGKRTSEYTAKAAPKSKKKPKKVSGYHLLGGMSAEAARTIKKGRYRYE